MRVCVLALLLAGCTATGDTTDDKRQTILDMEQAALKRFYKQMPELEERLKKAPGYAVFSNVGVTVIFFGGGGGYGVATDNETGTKTYMKMGEAQVGLGLGAKDFRALFLFNRADVMKKFVNDGWEFGGEADAAATASGKGPGEASGADSFEQGIEIYQITETGLKLKATINGTKYWKYDELN